MAENQKRPRVTDWLIATVVLAVAILLAVELGINVRDSRNGSQTCISTESTG